jgi:SAM-dependent methyltransferase
MVKPELMSVYDEFVGWYDILCHSEAGYDEGLVTFLDRQVFKKYGVRSILDCACGTGLQSIGLLKLGYEVMSSDLNQKMLDRAQVSAAHLGVRLNAYQVAWDRLSTSFAPGQFDAVICCGNSFYHLQNDEEKFACLSQMAAIVKKGGLCFIDYERWDEQFHEIDEKGETRPRGKYYWDRMIDGKRTHCFGLYDHEGRKQDFTVYLGIEPGENDKISVIKKFTFTGYAFRTEELMDLALKAGFSQVRTSTAPGMWNLKAIIAFK